MCEALKGQLQRSNIYNGPSDSHKWRSEMINKYNYKDDPSCRGVIDENLKKDLRASHYQIGEDDKFEKHTEYKEKYWKDKAKAVEKENQIHNLPAFRLGNKQGEYRTIYRNNYNPKMLTSNE